MTNEEKARELSLLNCNERLHCSYECKKCLKVRADDVVLQMARWKDEQFSAAKQKLIDNAKDFLAEYFWEHPHEKSVIQSDEFMSIDDMLEKFENRMKGGEL